IVEMVIYQPCQPANNRLWASWRCFSENTVEDFRRRSNFYDLDPTGIEQAFLRYGERLGAISFRLRHLLEDRWCVCLAGVGTDLAPAAVCGVEAIEVSLINGGLGGDALEHTRAAFRHEHAAPPAQPDNLTGRAVVRLHDFEFADIGFGVVLGLLSTGKIEAAAYRVIPSRTAA